MNLFHTFAAHCIAILVNFKTESHQIYLPCYEVNLENEISGIRKAK
jgi:hypothetical protein